MNRQNRFEAFVEHPVVSAVLGFVGLYAVIFLLAGARLQ